MTDQPAPDLTAQDVPAIIDMHRIPQRIGVDKHPGTGEILMTIMQPRATLVVSLNVEAARIVARQLLEKAGGIQLATELPDFKPNGTGP